MARYLIMRTLVLSLSPTAWCSHAAVPDSVTLRAIMDVAATRREDVAAVVASVGSR